MARLQSITECPPFPVINGVEFRHIPSWPGYAASSDGRIWSCYCGNRRWRWYWRERYQGTNPQGYRTVRIYAPHLCDGITRPVHSLVCEAFHGLRPDGTVCSHRDDVMDNNAASNLAWTRPVVVAIESPEQCPPLPVVYGIEFRHCPSWPGYIAGTDGSVWTCYPRNRNATSRKWVRLKEHKKYNGYITVNVRNPATGKVRIRTLAPMVCEAFHGPRPDGLDCCHNDSVTTNNAPDNLRWDTVQGNLEDARKLGRLHGRNVCRADDSPHAKLSRADVIEIRRLHHVVSAIELAKTYGVHVVHIRSIQCGMNRKWG